MRPSQKSGRGFVYWDGIFSRFGGECLFHLSGENLSLPVLMTGSHMDAVPQGGRWDGTAGVVAGLAAIKQLHDDGMQPEQDVVLVALRCEESAWFNVALLGSRFACGRCC